MSPQHPPGHHLRSKEASRLTDWPWPACGTWRQSEGYRAGNSMPPRWHQILPSNGSPRSPPGDNLLVLTPSSTERGSSPQVQEKLRSLATHRSQCSFFLNWRSLCVCVCVCVWYHCVFYLFVAALGLCCLARAFSSCSKRGLLAAEALMLWSTGPRHPSCNSCSLRALGYTGFSSRGSRA